MLFPPAKRFITVAALGLSALLAGCTASSVSTPSAETDMAAQRQTVLSTLTAHHWKLVSATDAGNKRIDALFPNPDRPFVLGFSDNRLSVRGGCNLRGGGFQLNTATQLVVGPMPATMMACETALMQADRAMAAVFARPVQIRIGAGTPAHLTLTTENQQTLEFTGTRTPESLYGAPTRIFLEVAPQTVACHHPLMPDARCLQVRERRYDEQGLRVGTPGEWQMFYDTIDGFTHQEGIRTVLRINRFNRPAPPADGSAYVYVLDMVVETEQVKP